MSETNTKHTPGPWFIDGMGNDPFCVAITAGELIDGPDFQRESKVAEVHTEADARLIAAAPELLEALQAALSTSGNFVGWEKRARAAVAKATRVQ